MNTKIYFLIMLLLSVGFHCMAQSILIQQEIDYNGNIYYAKLHTDIEPQPVSKSADFLKNLYNAKETDNFILSEARKRKQDELGHTHQYYQQYYRNVKVEHSEVGVHANKQGNIESVSGFFHAVGEVDMDAKLSEAQALKYALAYIGAEVYKWQIPEEEQWIKKYYDETYRPVGELVIMKERLKKDGIYRLAYRFDIYAHKPMSRDYVWVDAITGDIIGAVSRITFANTTGTAETRYSGTRIITTDSYDGSFRLRETRNGVNISTFNMNHTGNYTDTDFTDNDNNWTTAEHQANDNNAGLDAHWGTEMTYEYFKQKHDRNSWNDNDGPLLSYVNGDLVSLGFLNSNNAFWDGNKMTYGEGTTWPPVTALDICAHEIGHGVCESTANLVYQGESGAINESLSDIWGACVENWATTNKQTWLIGEDLGFTLRSMSNPKALGQPDTYGGTNWWNPSNLTWDNGGVHRNSGIMNYWFFLLSQGRSGTNDNGDAYIISGIGIDKAAKIVYRALTNHLLLNETFTLVRQHTIDATEYLYGKYSQETVSVTNAWHAVGVGDKYSLPITGPSLLCLNSSGIFSIANAPIGFIWDKSSNLTINSSSGNSASIKSTANGQAWVSIKNSGGVELGRINLWVGPPVLYGISGPDYAGSQETYCVSYPAYLNPSLYWQVTLGDGYIFNDWQQCVLVNFYGQQTYNLKVTATNACGSCYEQKIIYSSYRGFSAFPNPVDDILTVEIEEQARQQAGVISLSYDIRLYDINGVKRRQSTTKVSSVQFDVSNLPNGIYSLHIYDSTNSKPEMRTIMVRH